MFYFFRKCTVGILLFLLGAVAHVKADSVVDSLKSVINKSNSDIEKVDAYYQLAIWHLENNSPEMAKYVITGYQLSRDISYHEGIGKFCLLLAESQEDILSTDSLAGLITESETEFRLAGSPKNEAIAANKLGIIYERQGKYRLALKAYYRSLIIFHSLEDQRGIANSKNNIGLIFQLEKNYRTAIFFFNQAIEIGNSLKDDDILANAFNNIAICYQEQQQPKQALEYFIKVFEIDKKQNIPSNLALSYNNLGVVQHDLGNYTQAKEYLYKAIEAKQMVEESNGLANTYNNLASVFIKTNQLDSAGILLKMAIRNASREGLFPVLAESYSLASEMEEKKGNLKAALDYKSKEIALSDSISKAENKALFLQHEVDFRQLLKEKQNIEQEAEKQNYTLKRWLFVLVLLLLLMLISFLIYYTLKVKQAYKHLQVKQKKIEVQNKILQVKNIEVLQAKEAAEEAANVKSQFISTISHEIRTPLNAITGVSNLLQSGNPREDQLDNLNILKISSENLLQLVNNILDFSKLEAGKMQLENIEFNMRNLVFDIKDLFSVKATEKGIDLLVNYDEKVPAVLKGDPLRINQLLINLVNNAIKFTDTGYVRIDVNVQLSTINHVLLYFEVSDSGIGIPVSRQSKIFQSFTQAESSISRKFGGTGLGLSICKRILENLNSKLQLESEPGKGSRFYFTLNFEVSRNATAGKSSKTASFEDSIRGKRILVVEDNMMNIMVIRQFLQRWGVITEIAINGREGYNRVLEANFDAVLMDIHMPEMDGIEATKLIRKIPDERKRNVPIIALTAENEMQFRQKVYEVGMNDYIFKPFNPDDLRERLGYVLYNKAHGINKYRSEISNS